MMLRCLTALAVLCFSTSGLNAGVVINYTGPAEYAAAFDTAEAIWEGLLTGYQDGMVVSRSAGSSYFNGQMVSDVFIEANVEAIDGVGGILGSAGPNAVAVDSSGFTLATDGTMRFDSADVANLVSSGTWDDVILHEMGHVLGFGTLWTQNGVYTNNSGLYTGAAATAAWQSEFGQTGSPAVELGGGVGTANAHWNEVDNGAGPTGITDLQGRDLRDELMTGWLNGEAFISQMTVNSFQDIGFTVTAVPEPSGMGLCVIAALFCTRRRKQA